MFSFQSNGIAVYDTSTRETERVLNGIERKGFLRKSVATSVSIKVSMECISSMYYLVSVLDNYVGEQ